MGRYLRQALAAAASCLALQAGAAQVSEEAALKAAFIYRFAQFTQWPPPPLKDFTYCLSGSAEMGEALRSLAGRQHEFAQVRVLTLTLAQAGQAAAACQLLVLSQLERPEMLRWQLALSDAPVLIVADSPEALRSGAVIALAQEPNGLAFRINNSEAKRRGLILSSQLLKLAREVR